MKLKTVRILRNCRDSIIVEFLEGDALVRKETFWSENFTEYVKACEAWTIGQYGMITR
jgi:oligoribonuclease NrnB/cAMP/cGMP phosphodiesterase (DHH superfamily)